MTFYIYTFDSSAFNWHVSQLVYILILESHWLGTRVTVATLPTCPGAPLAGGPQQPAPDPERAAAARPLREHPHHQGQTLLQKVGIGCRYFLLIVDRNDCRRSSSNLSTKKRPSWCQDLPSSSLPLASSLAGAGGRGGGRGGRGLESPGAEHRPAGLRGHQEPGQGGGGGRGGGAQPLEHNTIYLHVLSRGRELSTAGESSDQLSARCVSLTPLTT